MLYGRRGSQYLWQTMDGQHRHIVYDHQHEYPYPLVHRDEVSGREDLVPTGRKYRQKHANDVVHTVTRLRADDSKCITGIE